MEPLTGFGVGADSARPSFRPDCETLIPETSGNDGHRRAIARQGEFIVHPSLWSLVLASAKSDELDRDSIGSRHRNLVVERNCVAAASRTCPSAYGSISGNGEASRLLSVLDGSCPATGMVNCFDVQKLGRDPRGSSGSKCPFSLAGSSLDLHAILDVRTVALVPARAWRRSRDPRGLLGLSQISIGILSQAVP